MTPSTAELLDAAWAVREHAHAPYSKFHVGAALRTKSGKIFTGCNVENLSYGLTICAERVAIGSMVAAGEMEIEEIVVVADTDKPISPCGACRQVMAEFGDFPLTMACKNSHESTTLSAIFPRAHTGILNRE